MSKNRPIVLIPLIIGFLAVAAVQTIFIPDNHEIWHLYEVLTIVAAVVFGLPGAVAGTVASVAAGIAGEPLDANMLLNFGRLAISAGLVGWFVQNHEPRQDTDAHPLLSDRLTGLHNYSYFIDRLPEECKRASRFGSRLALVMLDIDYFKRFNDKHGEQKGNDLLKQLAEILKTQVRGVDIVSRYGGEEFAILLPNTGKMAAEEVSERIRQAVEENEFSRVDDENTTVSIGVAVYPDVAADDLSLIDRANESLVKAKETGRNRVVIFGAPEQPHVATN